MIEAHAITHRIGTTTVLSDVSLTVKAGEVLALVGPNGAGKTTFLRILAGEIEATSGDVTIAGRSSREWTRERRGAPRAILTPEAGAVPYSCHEVVLLGRATRVDRRQSAKDRAVARLAMAATDTRVYEDRPYPTLSRGERHRVQAGRTLAQIWDEPDLRAVLFDEPTASLDLAQQHGMLRLARRMADARCAVVCVTHDLNLAAQYATSIAVLHRGRIHAVGAPKRVLSTSLLADVFEVDALVVPHPELSCPFIVTRGPVQRRPPSAGRFRAVLPPSSGRLPGGLL